MQATTTDGETCLHQAAYCNHKQVVTILLNNKCDVHAKTRLGQTPLYHAVRMNCKEIVEMLLEAGADVDLQDGKGASAAHIACKEGHTRVLQVGGELRYKI